MKTGKIANTREMGVGEGGLSYLVKHSTTYQRNMKKHMGVKVL